MIFERAKVLIINNLQLKLFTFRLMIKYKCVSFQDLNLEELYTIMVLRQEVFVVEQDCPYLDADGKDQASWHVMGTDAAGKLKAYTRICPPGVSYDGYVSIGRVIIDEEIRGTQEGYRLMEKSIAECEDRFPGLASKLSAQSHLERFYNKLGYKAVGEGYLEDGIPHIAMIRS